MTQIGFEQEFLTTLVTDTMVDNIVNICRKVNVLCGLIASNKVSYQVVRQALQPVTNCRRGSVASM